MFSVIFNGILEPALSQVDLLRHVKFLVFACALCVIFMETLRGTSDHQPAENPRLQGLRIAGYGALAFGIFSLIYNLAGLNVTHDYRLLGPLDAAVYLGYYLAPFFIFFGVSWLDRRTRTDLICALLLGLLLLATRSMGSLAASVVILCFYLWKSRGSAISSRTKKLIAIALTLLSVAVFYTKILPTIQTEYSSLDERGEIWSTATELAKAPGVWLHGLGLSQFEAHYIATADQVLGRPPLDYHVIQPHNIFFLFLFHYGVLGLIFLGFLIWKTAAVLFKKIDQNKGSANQQTASTKVTTTDLQTIAALLAFYFFIHGLIDTPIYKNDLLFLFLLFLSLSAPANAAALSDRSN